MVACIRCRVISSHLPRGGTVPNFQNIITWGDYGRHVPTVAQVHTRIHKEGGTSRHGNSPTTRQLPVAAAAAAYPLNATS